MRELKLFFGGMTIKHVLAFTVYVAVLVVSHFYDVPVIVLLASIYLV
jgi:hypothetical protein